jgi:hypothetical protein
MSPSAQQEYDEVMLTADVGVRKLERHISKMEAVLNRAASELEGGRHPKNRMQCIRSALESLANLQAALHSPDLARWRQERAEADSTRRRHLEILTQKLLVAKKLLVDVGWDAELLEEHLKAHVPEGRRLAQRKFQIRNARKRVASQGESA